MKFQTAKEINHHASVKAGRSLPLRQLHLVLSDESNICDIAEAIRSLTSVNSIILSCYNQIEPAWWDLPLAGLFYAFGSLRTLRSFKMECIGQDSGKMHFPVMWLVYMLQQPTCRLTSLYFNKVQLQYNRSWFVLFAEKLGTQTDLKRFQFQKCSFWDQDEHVFNADAFLDPVVKSLSAIPKLRRLSITVNEHLEDHLWLFRTDILQKLMTCSPSPSSPYGSHSPRSVELDDMDNDGLVAVAEALRTNDKMKSLAISVYGETTTGCTAFADMLQINHTLEHLRIRAGGTFEADEFLSETAVSLAYNDTLKSLKLFGFRKLNPNHEGSYAKMLETNQVLEELALSRWRRGEKKTPYCGKNRRLIDYFLRLNQYGRRRLTNDFETTTPQDWVQVLSMCSSDLDALYYFVSMNPSLCTL